MPYFVLAGITQCPLFNHARHVADYLSCRLPNFKVTVLEKDLGVWKSWLQTVNLKNKWYHDKTLIVWKELTIRGGTPYLIGGLSEFWEYCNDYYGLESFLSRDELQKLNTDFQQYYMLRAQSTDEVTSNRTIVCIIGRDVQMELLLVMQLLELNEIFTRGLTIRVYDLENYDENVQSTFETATEVMQPKFTFQIEAVDTLEKGLKGCELLVITGDITRTANEQHYLWLNRNYVYMMQIAKQLNLHAENYLKVILAMHGPVCFNASVLLETVTKVHLYNIVAVTADLGLQVLDCVSKLTSIPLADLSAPPVWGFIGANQIVDVEHTIHRYNVYLPNARAAKGIPGSTLRLGRYVCELRFVCYALNNIENLWSQIHGAQRADCDTTARTSRLPKIRAIISLIENWYATAETGNVISLGIMSNGSFGIPQGFVFSQPVCLNHKKWVPAKDFPPPRKDPCTIADFMPMVHDIFKHFNLRDEIDA